ncbi:hypothetical protein P022_gp43 [Pelagibacter phage HTVC022P]|nr:hypothetical protein P022_gp43 [Pelagibacter phage HTVC022P]
MTKARDLADIAGAIANDKIPSSKLDVSFENISDTGTEGTKVATGTTAQRGSTAGQIRFNTTTGLAEYYTGTAFKSIDAPPTISSIDVTEVDSQAGGNQTIVITGSGFTSGATVIFVGASGTDFNASTVTVDSDTQITAVAPKSSFLNAQEPYGVKVTNVSGLSATFVNQINVDSNPVWSTASGQIGGNLFEGDTINVSATATDSDGDTIAYSVQSGSLPSGTSLNLSTGAITGTASAVSADTTSSFTLRATANSKTADRAFNIIIKNDLIAVVDFFGDNSGKSLYRFEGNGTDSGGVSNMGFGHPSISNNHTFPTGKFGNGVKKLHGGSYGFIGNRSYSSFSVSMWAKFENIYNSGSDLTFKGIFGHQSAGQLILSQSNSNMYLGIYRSGTTSYSSGNGSDIARYVANNASTISNDTWYHLAYTGSGSNTKLYVNGVEGKSFSEATDLSDGNGYLYLGTASSQLGNATYDTEGTFDNIRIFNKQLSQSEITSLYNFESNR